MADLEQDPFLQCSLKLNYLNSTGASTRQVSNVKSFLQLGRNEFRDIVMKVECGKVCASFFIKDMVLNTRFVKDGKATITLPNPSLQIFISNCPTMKLGIFLKTLAAKVAKLQVSKPVGTKERLLSEKPASFTEISPLTAIDVNVLHNKVKEAKEKQKPLWPQTPKTAKRKRESDDKENVVTPTRAPVTPSRPLVSRPLTSEQRKVLSAVMAGRNIFFTGSAGTGKSFLLRRVLGALAPDSTCATASTGAAACQIGGVTLHAFAGIGCGTAPVQQCIERALRNASTWRKCRHLVVDEISMVDGEFFQKLDKIAKVVRKCDKPFGGIQLILSGDFLQLPPVVQPGKERKFCFQTPAWRESIEVNIELQIVKRQSDKNFIDLLQEVRKGRSSKGVLERLKATSKRSVNRDRILATVLSTHKDDVDVLNSSHLEKLPGAPQIFHGVDSSPDLRQYMDNHCPVLDRIELKIGAQVMLTKNLDVHKGLVNGARGVVTGFHSCNQKLPIVKFACGVENIVKYEKWTFRAPSGVTLIRKMLPLKLAWAMSIHKSQGMTLDCVEVSLARVFECGQAYVALSRARSLEGLRVLDIEPSSIRADPQVLRFYAKLHCESSWHQSRLDDYTDL